MGMEENLEIKFLPQVKQHLIILKELLFSKKFYHIGPPRILIYLMILKIINLKNYDKCQYFLCTGLFDEL